MPAWLTLAGCHGEFELVFTIPADQEALFLAEAKEHHLHPECLGQVIEGSGVIFAWDGKPTPIDSGWLRNRAAEAANDVRAYIHALVEYAREVGK